MASRLASPQIAVPDLLGGSAGPVVAAGTDNHGMPGHREPAGQPASLFAGAAQNGNDKPVEGRRSGAWYCVMGELSHYARGISTATFGCG